MRRPPYGLRILRGLRLIVEETKRNIGLGIFGALWWTSDDRRDMKYALEWITKFIAWTEVKKEKRKDEDV